MINRKKFLKIGAGTAASLAITRYLSPVMAQANAPNFYPGAGTAAPPLLWLEAQPPTGTKAVRFYIDDMQVAELTNLYAQKTNTTPVWKTCTDASWFSAGTHELRIEADTPQGKETLKKEPVVIESFSSSPDKIALTGAWQFATLNDLPAGALEGDRPVAISPDFSGGSWTKIAVPNSLGAISDQWNVYEGILGIYKKEIELQPLANHRHLAIILESCYWLGRVFINGTEVGQTKGGYLPSRFDITGQVKPGKNTVAIIVDNRFATMGVFKRINEFYWNWGGLLQEVYLESHTMVCATALRAEGNAAGKLQLHLHTINKTDQPSTIMASVEVAIKAGQKTGQKVLGPVAVSVTIPVGETVIALSPLQVKSPLLWDLEQPHLYTVTLKLAGQQFTETTGFRDIKVDGRDILLNGKVLQNLQGFDRHADYPGLGRTQPAGLPYQELKELRDKGYRFFRPAHYPTTPAQLNAADELGLLVIEEINVTGLKGDVLASKEVKEFAAAQITKMINRDRSHPCIMGWSVGNENFTEEPGAAEYVKDTIAVGRSLDPHRLFTQVTHRHTTDTTFAYQDFVAQNYYAGWYAKDVNVIPNLLESVQAYAGNKPIILSEYGAEAIVGKPGTDKSTEFYQGFVVDAHNRLLNNMKHFFGKMYWSSSEFWCRPNWTGGSPFPIAPFHVKGLISLDRAHKKLGWRVMFSPVRLVFNPHTVKTNDLGGDFDLVLDKETKIRQVITIKEVRNTKATGKVRVEVPEGFTMLKTEYPFSLQPGEDASITLDITGSLTAQRPLASFFIRAVIDEDTEAQPLLLTIKAPAPKA